MLVNVFQYFIMRFEYENKNNSNILGKPQSYDANITLGITDLTGIEFSITIIAYPEPQYELQYENGTKNIQMMDRITRNALNNFTIHYNQTVVGQSDYGIYHLILSNKYGKSILYVNIIPQSKYQMTKNNVLFVNS